MPSKQSAEHTHLGHRDLRIVRQLVDHRRQQAVRCAERQAQRGVLDDQIARVCALVIGFVVHC